MRDDLPLLFDATRLLARARFDTPTGIDRVDLAYAQHLLGEAHRNAALIAFDAFGPWRLPAAAAATLVTGTAARWQSTGRPPSPLFPALCRWLAAPAGMARPAAFGAVPATGVDLPHGVPLWRRPRLPAVPALYLNTSHGRLHRAGVSRWLRRSGSAGVFFIHDLIPIEFPQYNRAAEPAKHAARLRTVARHARRVIVNSRTTRDALADWLRNERLPVPAIEVIPLGVAEAFQSSRTVALPPTARPYFVVLGTLEPRKNHALLLRLWRRFTIDWPDGPPRLVLVGRRGWENAALFAELDGETALHPWVAEAPGLADGEIAQLLRGARALLAPSFAEGFGLPLAEALACGTPVVASDLPAHRETAGAAAEYLDPREDAAWAQAIVDYADQDHPRQAWTLDARRRYRPLTWPEHTAQALAAIRAG